MISDNKIKVIRQTSFKKYNTSELLSNDNEITCTYNETYDFSKSEHRKDILSIIVNQMLTSSNYNIDILNELQKETSEIIEEMKKELPFL